MYNEFTAIVEQDGEWFIAYCLKSQALTDKAARSKSAARI